MARNSRVGMLSVLAGAALGGGLGGAAWAQPVVDGQLDAEYGAANFTQFITTQFGDSMDPDPVTSNGGSEIDGVYTRVVGDRLYVFVAGNLETNFNKLVLFFDVQEGGQNRILGNQPGGLGRMGTQGDEPGLTFDAGFNADYFISVTTGTFNNDTSEDTSDDYVAVFGDAATVLTDGPVTDPFTGASLSYNASDRNLAAGGVVPFDGPEFELPDEAAGAFPFTRYGPRRSSELGEMGMSPSVSDEGLIQIAINNSNTAGVAGSGDGALADQDAAAAVMTGIELSIALSELRDEDLPAANPIRIAGWVSSGDFGYLSNQVIGGLPVGTRNLGTVGDVRSLNFATIPGDQYIRVGQSAVEPIQICRADLTGDNRATVQDLLAYLSLFRAKEGCN